MIAYARTLNPELTDEVDTILGDYYENIRKESQAIIWQLQLGNFCPFITWQKQRTCPFRNRGYLRRCSICNSCF